VTPFEAFKATGRDAVDLDFADLAPERILAFLDHLEAHRKNGVTTRNARLAAIHSFARHAAANHPEHLELCQRILAVPYKRGRQRVVEYLEAGEMRALSDAPAAELRQKIRTAMESVGPIVSGMDDADVLKLLERVAVGWDDVPPWWKAELVAHKQPLARAFRLAKPPTAGRNDEIGVAINRIAVSAAVSVNGCHPRCLDSAHRGSLFPGNLDRPLPGGSACARVGQTPAQDGGSV
jgi:integrase